MKKTIYTIALAISLTGCAASRDGMRFGSGPSNDDIAKVKNQIAENAQKTAVKKAAAAALAPESRPGLLAIGETGVLHELDPKKSKKNYKEFSDIAEKWHPGIAPYMSEDEYTRLIGGWTTIEIYSIPGIMAFKVGAAIPKEKMADIQFASVAGAWLINSTKDLVVARSTEDGIVVIETILCSSLLKDFSKCSDQYTRGQFDAQSGQELDRSAKIKPDGVRIDTTTFKKI
jgi:hypothetical protein